MSCKLKSDLVHFIYGEVSPEMNQKIKEHLNECFECKAELETLTDTKEILAYWEDISPSEELSKALATGIKDCIQEKSGNFEEIKQAFISMIKTLSPGICGTLVTTIMVILMSGTAQVDYLNPLSLLICGVFWSGTYSMIFDLAIKNGSYSSGVHMRELLGLNLKLSVYYAFIALGIGLILLLTSPLSGFEVTYYQEFLYSFIPLLITGYLISRKSIEHHVLHGVFLGILYMLMIGPALYMQCLNVNFNIYILLIITSSVGALTGGMAGTWIGSHILTSPKRRHAQ
jgi:hypothetical protein